MKPRKPLQAAPEPAGKPPMHAMGGGQVPRRRGMTPQLLGPAERETKMQAKRQEAQAARAEKQRLRHAKTQAQMSNLARDLLIRKKGEQKRQQKNEEIVNILQGPQGPGDVERVVSEERGTGAGLAPKPWNLIAAQQPATQQARGLSLFKERLGKQQPAKQQPIPEPRVESPDKREAEPDLVEPPKAVERADAIGACSPGTTDAAT